MCVGYVALRPDSPRPRAPYRSRKRDLYARVLGITPVHGSDRRLYVLLAMSTWSSSAASRHGSTSTGPVVRSFARNVRKHDLPGRIHSDNGVPFARSGVGLLLRVGV